MLTEAGDKSMRSRPGGATTKHIQLAEVYPVALAAMTIGRTVIERLTPCRLVQSADGERL